MSKKGFLAGFGVLGLCALCCALPLLIGGTSIIGLSSLVLNPIWFIIIAVVVVGVGVLRFRKKSKSCTICEVDGKCNCK